MGEEINTEKITTPNLTGSAKIAWAVITYITAGVLYSGISTPITSILPNLSSDADERIVDRKSVV